MENADPVIVSTEEPAETPTPEVATVASPQPLEDTKAKELQDKYRRANSEAVRLQREAEELRKRLEEQSMASDELSKYKDYASEVEAKLKEQNAYFEGQVAILSKNNPIADEIKDLPAMKQLAILQKLVPQPTVSFAKTEEPAKGTQTKAFELLHRR